jgi:replicative DNA helicase
MNIDPDFFEYVFTYECLKKPSFYKMVREYMSLDYFDVGNTKTVLRMMDTFYEENRKVPSLSEIKLGLTSDNQKKSFREFLKVIKDIDSVNHDLIVKQTEKLFQEQAVSNALLDVSKKYQKGEISNSEIVAMFKKACGITLIDDIGHHYFQNIDDHIKYLKTEQEKISTGYDFVDKKLGGGVLKNGRALYMIMGATNSGKSVWLANFAANFAKQGFLVPIITLEMSEQIYCQRLSANMSGIEMDQLKHDTEKLKDFAHDFNIKNPHTEILVKEFPPAQLTPAKLDVYLEKVANTGYTMGPVMLDYLTLMAGDRGEGMYEKGKGIAEDVRALSYKFNSSMFSAIQANREGTENKMPHLHHMSESMGVAHTADFVMPIWREEEDIETNTIRGGIAKNRMGENFGMCMFETDFAKMKILQQEEVFEGEEEEFEKVQTAIEGLSDFD